MPRANEMHVVRRYGPDTCDRARARRPPGRSSAPHRPDRRNRRSSYCSDSRRSVETPIFTLPAVTIRRSPSCVSEAWQRSIRAWVVPRDHLERKRSRLNRDFIRDGPGPRRSARRAAGCRRSRCGSQPVNGPPGQPAGAGAATEYGSGPRQGRGCVGALQQRAQVPPVAIDDRIGAHISERLDRERRIEAAIEGKVELPTTKRFGMSQLWP